MALTTCEADRRASIWWLQFDEWVAWKWQLVLPKWSPYPHDKCQLGDPVHSVLGVGALEPVMATSWSYWTAHSGPAHWKLQYHDARGCRQSPINITESDVRWDHGLVPKDDLQVSYDRSDCCEVDNIGYMWKIGTKEKCRSHITAKYLHGTYILHHVHAHWGTGSYNGSEHLVNGKGYAGEVHIVHYNSKYASLDEALKHADGVAVLGMFLKESLHDSPLFEQLGHYLAQVPHKGQSVELPRGFNIKKLIPENREFWTYHGSLTTPPCHECVTWTLFRTPLTISKRQLDIFRSLYASNPDSESPIKMVNNIRPVQPLHNRPIRASFTHGNGSKPVRLPPIHSPQV